MFVVALFVVGRVGGSIRVCIGEWRGEMWRMYIRDFYIVIRSNRFVFIGR